MLFGVKVPTNEAEVWSKLAGTLGIGLCSQEPPRGGLALLLRLSELPRAELGEGDRRGRSGLVRGAADISVAEKE